MKPLSVGLDETLARIERMRQKAKEQGQTAPKAPETAQVIKLPVWPEQVRAVPNGFLRSALFGAIARGKRRYMKKEHIASLDGVEIRYTGERLDQGDLDVWEAVLHLLRFEPLGNECNVTAYQLLKLLGKKDTGGNREVLENRLTRMKATALEIESKKHVYMGSLIDEVYKNKETKEYQIRLNPKLKALYEVDQFTQMQRSIRQELEGQPLAQWLYGFFSSHAQPYPIKIETLHKLCGSETVEIWKFTQNLRKALEAVSQACNLHEQPCTFEVDKAMILTERKASKSQRKYLKNKNDTVPADRFLVLKSIPSQKVGDTVAEGR